MTTRLELAAVSKAFGARAVLQRAWLQVRDGEAVGLVGPNGAGKTTMLRIAAGLVRPDGGSVRWGEPRCAMRYFGGEMTLPPGVTGDRWARLFRVKNDRPEPRTMGALSRGSRQLLGLRIVLDSPSEALVILDEPWEGLDPAGSIWLAHAIRRWRDAGAAVLVSSHRLHDLDAVCSRFVMLDRGRCHPVAASDAPRSRVEQLTEAFADRSR